MFEEAGGVARQFDGTPYRPADGRDGLLLAPTDAAWRAVRDTLLG